jgi:hypothetical protein
MQAEEPEQPRGRRAQRPVRAGEHRPDVGGGVVAGEGVEAWLSVA